MQTIKISSYMQLYFNKEYFFDWVFYIDLANFILTCRTILQTLAQQSHYNRKLKIVFERPTK